MSRRRGPIRTPSGRHRLDVRCRGMMTVRPIDLQIWEGNMVVTAVHPGLGFHGFGCPRVVAVCIDSARCWRAEI